MVEFGNFGSLHLHCSRRKEKKVSKTALMTLKHHNTIHDSILWAKRTLGDTVVKLSMVEVLGKEE